MNEPVAFYPWLVQWKSVGEMLLGGVLAVVVLYIWLRAGRDRVNEPGTSFKPPLHDYAGIIQSGSNKVPVFLVIFIIGVTLFSVLYIANVAIHGGLDY